MPTQFVSRRAAESLRILMRELVDYAGLFPPAALKMEQNVENFARYGRSEHSWILNCCVVPASRLVEFAGALAKVPATERAGRPWKLSVLVGTNVEAEIAQIEAFNDRHAQMTNGSSVVDTLEIKTADAEAVREAATKIPRTVQTYFEVPLSDGLTESVAAIRECGACAKVRTGGVTPGVFPSPEQVARFLDECAKARIRFKATAGLHHPIRAVQRLTYEPNSSIGVMFGFLNVFLAAAYVFHGMDRQDAALLLDERSAGQIHFNDDGVAWRGHPLDNQQLASTRQSFCTSFGSCSFEEPIEDLRGLGLL